MSTDIILVIVALVFGYCAWLFHRIEVAVWEIRESLRVLESDKIKSIWVNTENAGVQKFNVEDIESEQPE